MKTPAECRKEAEECRIMAADAGNPGEKAFWLELAKEWLDIAADLESSSTAAVVRSA